MTQDRTNTIAQGGATAVLHAGNARFELVRIPPGEFDMGSFDGEAKHTANEAPVRRVRITRAFYLGRCEVTRGQYASVMGAGADPAGDPLPMSDVSFAQAQAFVERLSAITQAAVSLPTEAQWEYACRAGAPVGTDLQRVAWTRENAGGTAHPVGSLQANAWGLHDMLGNVWEYCTDFIDDYATMDDTDPVGQVTGRDGAMRGGGWMHGAEHCRPAVRLISDDMFGGAGIRIAVSADAASEGLS